MRARWKTLAVMTAGAALIILGAAQGEFMIVMRKAIRVCMECIGLG